MKPNLTLNTMTMFSSDHTNTTTTLTPTTLKTITQLFDSDDCLNSIQEFERSGFIPPPAPAPVPTILEFKKPFGNSFCGGTTTVVTPIKEEPMIMEPMNIEPLRIPLKEEQYNSDYSDQSDEDYQPQPKRRMHQTRASTGRKNNNNNNNIVVAVKSDPSKPKRRGNMKNDYDGLAPSERQKLIQRRERNKQAAARCRQRREDLTHTLMQQVKMWEGKKDDLQQEINELRAQKQELEYILQLHSATCTLGKMQTQVVAVKSEPHVIVEPVNAPYIVQEEKRKRPMSLTIPFAADLVMDQSGPEGVLIETPSTVIPSFESFMSGSTGLTPVVSISGPSFYTSSNNFLNTPVVPTCSIQQRSTESQDLNTPSEPTHLSLVSL